MTAKEALLELVGTLTEAEARDVLASLEDRAADGLDEQEGAVVLDAREYPRLAEIWDNEDDAIFDTL